MAKSKGPRNSKEFKTLKAAMLDALKKRGLDNALYQDKVNEYMDLWVLMKELQRDVEERGLVVYDDRNRMSENRSVSLKVQVSRQMLALFTAMGFKPEELNGAGGEDDDDL